MWLQQSGRIRAEHVFFISQSLLHRMSLEMEDAMDSVLWKRTLIYDRPDCCADNGLLNKRETHFLFYINVTFFPVKAWHHCSRRAEQSRGAQPNNGSCWKVLMLSVCNVAQNPEPTVGIRNGPQESGRTSVHQLQTHRVFYVSFWNFTKWSAKVGCDWS